MSIRHDRRLAGAGCQFQRDPQQLRVRSLLALRRWVQILPPAAARSEATSASQIAVSTASIWQKNGLISLNLVMSPVLEQPRRLGCNPPLVRVRQTTPVIDIAADSLIIRGTSYCCSGV